ncbi:MAG: TRAP transporter substrate-binding protein, partial [Alphaproteobacteria bacterium]
MAGKGAFQNVTDIVFARGIDIGIIQSDVLAALKRNPPFPHVESFLQYITRLYDEEVHILAAKGVNSTADLASKKVNFGLSGSGTDMTAGV